MPSDISEFSVVKEKEQLNGLKSLIASAYFNQKISEFSVVKKIHLRNLINLAASQQIKQVFPPARAVILKNADAIVFIVLIVFIFSEIGVNCSF